MYRSALVGLAVVVVLVAISGGVVLATDSAAVTDQPAAGDTRDTGDRLEQYSAPEDETSQDFDSTTFEITVHENGDATWTFRYERLLDDDEVSAFEEFAEEFTEEETDFYVRFTEQAQGLADTGTAETDREMDATEFNRTAGVDYRPNAMGYVEMSFTWTNFASTDDETVVVGDVFDGGLYIGPSQSLVIQPGDGLVLADTTPDGEYTGPSLEDSSSVSWSGERDFHDGQPRVVLEPPEDDTDNVTTTDGDDEDDASAWPLAAGLVAVLGLGGALAWYRYGGSTADSNDDGTDEQPPSVAPEPEPVATEELMTDEDRVVNLIRENGGRMKQVDIVDETGWSKSKVSMLLSDMEEEGTISKLRVGRENIISLDGYEPEAAKSPLDE
ncbi:helix-turn-helix transcriptional regulator [Natrialbaceae archaeon AArc-T1-2]|uniref:helix-turn-helix transcriptional regulator n=1 Tax=Natrialbaceae archaeon AArc-T1-2 TaxID=3053904 RepID=UPI00255AAF59|nr:helix-turn-helix domain-containing protein [Natrialbaceae archaeon AArc-T1-2]WIV66577.1 helix-turn-helix domain-containing protein [Natrialbaceae archaeon AArc-T1-2]